LHAFHTTYKVYIKMKAVIILL